MPAIECSAARKLARLTLNCSASSRSAGSLSPGLSSPVSIMVWMRRRTTSAVDPALYCLLLSGRVRLRDRLQAAS